MTVKQLPCNHPNSHYKHSYPMENYLTNIDNKHRSSCRLPDCTMTVDYLYSDTINNLYVEYLVWILNTVTLL